MASFIMIFTVVIAMFLSSGLTAWIIWKFRGNVIRTSFLTDDKNTDSGNKSIINSPSRETRILDEIFKKEMNGEL